MTDLGLTFLEAPPAPATLNFLLYGPPGSGKSTAAATAPGPILWINAEGPNALAYARKTATARGTGILEVAVPRGEDPRPILDQVYVHVRDRKDPAPATVVVDTLGKLRDALIASMVVPGAKNSLQQFGQVADKLGGFINHMRDLPVNLVLLAHEDVQDADGGDRIIRPLIGGKLTEGIPAEVDVMAHCNVIREGDVKQYVGLLVESRGRRAKDRSGGLGDFRPLDLSEWGDAFRAALLPDESGLPWADPAVEGEPQQQELTT
jgi:hypothetical protein